MEEQKQTAGDSSQRSGGTGQIPDNGIGLEISKEPSDSGTDVVGKDEPQSLLMEKSCQAASFSGESKELDATVNELRPSVGSANGRTVGGHENVDALDEGGEGSGLNSDESGVHQSVILVEINEGSREGVVVDAVKAKDKKMADDEFMGKVPKGEKASPYVIDMNWDGEKVCRICHLSSEGSIEAVTAAAAAAHGVTVTSMELIQLGCGCKDELGVAHSHCGEAWFKLKGNRVCEICGEMAKNITGVGDNVSFMEEWNQMRLIHGGANQPERGGGCWRGQPFCNFLMACLVIAFVLPWFFRVNMF
ncbi:hypothetical protein LINPERPRIM_LOCUS34175 [Linum perenne]